MALKNIKSSFSHVPPLLFSSRHAGLDLDAVPLLDQVTESGIDQALLLKHVEATELLGADVDTIHGAAASRDVSHDEVGRRKFADQDVPNLGLSLIQVFRLFRDSARRLFRSCGRVCPRGKASRGLNGALLKKSRGRVCGRCREACRS